MQYRILFLLLLSLPVLAQRNLVELRSQTRPQLQNARDLGALREEERIDEIRVHFARSPQQQTDLDRLLDRQHDTKSADFHRWLSPEQFANQFGAPESEIAKLQGWLRGEGFDVLHTARSRTYVAIAGPARSVKRAFGAELHRFEYGGKRHFAAATVARVPQEFSSLVLHIEGLDDFLPEPQTRVTPVPEANSANGDHYLAPDDLAVIYNIRPSYQSGIDGGNQKIVIAGQSAIDLADIRTYRRRFNLPANDPQPMLYAGGVDPGFTGGQIEANLDLEIAGAVARNAKIYYVYGRSVLSALSYAIDQNLAPVVSVSFSFGCEAQLSFSTLTFVRNLAQQANAQGITWVNSSGDAGPAGCDLNGSSVAQNGYGARSPASTPEVTAVGGTELNDRGGSYWNRTNDANLSSVISYIPEIPWNESGSLNILLVGGGGISTFHLRPSWQAGPGVGTEQYRKVPDVSLAASSYNGYYITHRGLGYIVSGTSASAPAFAGLIGLLLQATGQSGFGNANRFLYPLAQTNPEAFHDITSGDTIVPCVGGSKDCTNGSFGFRAGPGYDMATGLGSVDFEQLARVWPRQAATRSLITLSSSKNPVYAQSTTSGLSWVFTLTLQEHNGVATRVTSFKIDSIDATSQIPSLFGTSAIAAGASISAGIGSTPPQVPLTRSVELSGRDDSGETWTQSIQLTFLGLPPTPAIGGVAHGASFNQTFAPGMILSVFGSALAPATQAAGAVPLLEFMGGITATINGVNAPFYYVSPGQVNLQIPYETAPGLARLVMNYGTLSSTTFTFNVAPVAPGIFVGQDAFVVPSTSCARGQTCILFITGQGAVSPAIATGAAPSGSATLAQLPKPTANVSVTIGGVPAAIAFAGIPPFLVGVTQINFTVAANTPAGTQNVIVRVGNVDSPPAKINVP